MTTKQFDTPHNSMDTPPTTADKHKHDDEGDNITSRRRHASRTSTDAPDSESRLSAPVTDGGLLYNGDPASQAHYHQETRRTQVDPLQ